MGASAGLIPCPTALVVLLGAIAQHEVPLGLVLILAFSAGLATTLTVLGILVVKAARLPVPGRVAVVLPALSALAIVGLGLALTLRAVPQIAG
jgi:nickel/cobalt exporter